MKQWWLKYWPEVSLGVVGLFFLGLYQFLYFNVSQVETLIFNQPDEMANYAFIKEWTVNGGVGIIEPLSAISLNQVHPRSMTVVGERLVPIGFPGFIALVSSLLRPLVWIFGGEIFNVLVVMVTPLVAVFSAWLIFGIIRTLGLDKRTALVGGLALLILPPWWYYASRPLQSNTLFVFFILAGIWAGLLKNTNWTRWFLVGLSFGLSLYVRPSEWVWVFGLIGLLGYYHRESLNFKRVLSFGFGLLIMMVIFFLTQFVFYGNWLGSGYVRPNLDGTAGLFMTGPQGIYWLKALFLPFGFNGLAILTTAYHYGFKLFLPWLVTALLGFGFIFGQRKKYPLFFNYTLSLLGLGLWLLLYYGSWQFTDNLAGHVSIGSSQVRYLLPVYVLSIPLVAYLISVVYSWNWSGKLVASLIGVALLGSSVKAVFYKFEGLSLVNASVNQYYDWQEKILDLTPENAIIVTRYADKYLFPDRMVITTVDTIDGQRGIKNLLARGADVYWYDIASKKSGDDTDSGILALQEQGLLLGKSLGNWENLELREITLIK